MARLRNTATGVVFSVSDEHAERLVGQGYQPVDVEKKTTAKRSPNKQANDDK